MHEQGTIEDENFKINTITIASKIMDYDPAIPLLGLYPKNPESGQRSPSHCWCQPCVLEVLHSSICSLPAKMEA